MSEIILTVDGVDPLELFGENNAKLNLLRKAFPEITITSRGNNLKLAGEKKFTQAAKAKFEMMVKLLKEQHTLSTQAVEDLLLGENLWETRLPESDNNRTSLQLVLRVQVKPTPQLHWRCGRSKTARSKRSS